MEQILKITHFSELSLCLRLFLWDIRKKGILSFFFFHLQSLWNSWTSPRTESPTPKHQKQSSRCVMQNGVRLNREEVIMVMGELGLRVESDGEGLEGVFGEEEVEEIMLEMIESVADEETMKSAFEVFDENGDGFIEGRELQRVLKCLGLERDVGDCERMIGAFDENGDGMIDHNEFVKFMQQSFDDVN